MIPQEGRRSRLRPLHNLSRVPTEDLLAEIKRRVRLRLLPPAHLFGAIPPPLWREAPGDQPTLIEVTCKEPRP